MNVYDFALESFHVFETRSPQADTDYFRSTLKIGRQSHDVGLVQVAIEARAGQDYPGPGSSGAIPIVSPRTPVVLSFVIANAGHDAPGIDGRLAASVDLVASTLAGTTSLTESGAILASPWLLIAAGAIEALSALWNIVFADCDGWVAGDAIALSRADIDRLIRRAGGDVYRETKGYAGVDSPAGCGANSDYSVTWSVSRQVGWVEVPGDGTTDASLAAASYQGSLFIFAKGIDDQRIYANLLDDLSGWSGWKEVGGDGHTDAGMAAAPFNGRLYLFVKGIEDRKLYVNQLGPVEDWQGWSQVPDDPARDARDLQTDAGPAVAEFRNRLFLFAKGADDQKIYVNSTADVSGWSAWAEVGGFGRTAVGLTAARLKRCLLLFAVGNDAGVYVNRTADGTRWGGWNLLDADFNVAAPLAAAAFDGRVHVFATSADDGTVSSNSTADGENWSGWRQIESAIALATDVEGAMATDTAPAACGFDDHTYIFVKNSADNKIFLY
jgi:hypothetical protein